MTSTAGKQWVPSVRGPGDETHRLERCVLPPPSPHGRRREAVQI